MFLLSARAELPPLRVDATVETRLPLELPILALLLMRGSRLVVSSVVVVVVVATPFIAIVIVGLCLCPFLRPVPAWYRFERDGLLGVLTGL